jgi:hypothetical protein
MTCPGSRVPIEPAAVGCRTAIEVTRLAFICWCCGRRLSPVVTVRGLEIPVHNRPVA